MAVSRMAVITFIDGGGGSPDNSLPGGGGLPDNSLPGGGWNHPWWGGPGNRPDNSLPGGGGHPGNALPGGGHIALLPVFPFDPTRPDGGLPPSGAGGGERPDNALPGIRPGAKFVVKWLACQGLILVPDNELPETPEPK